jgi:hypothetical protein
MTQVGRITTAIRGKIERLKISRETLRYNELVAESGDGSCGSVLMKNAFGDSLMEKRSGFAQKSGSFCVFLFHGAQIFLDNGFYFGSVRHISEAPFFVLAHSFEC